MSNSVANVPTNLPAIRKLLTYGTTQHRNPSHPRVERRTKNLSPRQQRRLRAKERIARRRR